MNPGEKVAIKGCKGRDDKSCVEGCKKLMGDLTISIKFMEELEAAIVLCKS